MCICVCVSVCVIHVVFMIMTLHVYINTEKMSTSTKHQRVKVLLRRMSELELKARQTEIRNSQHGNTIIMIIIMIKFVLWKNLFLLL